MKNMTDVAVRMAEEQLVELRANIKHFVSEQKYDDDLGKIAWFICGVETLKKSIDSFGQVSHMKNSNLTSSQCSSVVLSLNSPGDKSAAPSWPCASSPSLCSPRCDVSSLDKLQWLVLPGISRKQARRTRPQATKSGHCPHKRRVA